MPQLSWFGNGVKDPAALTGSRIVAANMARSFGIRTFAASATGDHNVLIDHDRAAVTEREVSHLMIETRSEIEHALVAKGLYRLARLRVQRITVSLCNAFANMV